MKITKKILLFLVLVSAGFAFGIAIEHGKFNPYYQVLEVYERNIIKAQKMLGMETAKPVKTVIVNTEWNIPRGGYQSHFHDRKYGAHPDARRRHGHGHGR